MEQFLVTLALCHTVTITGNRNRSSFSSSLDDIDSITCSMEDNSFEYQASSPDEKALAEACRRSQLIEMLLFCQLTLSLKDCN